MKGRFQNAINTSDLGTKLLNAAGGLLAMSLMQEPWFQVVMTGNSPHSSGCPRLARDPFNPEYMAYFAAPRVHFYTARTAVEPAVDEETRETTTDNFHHPFGIDGSSVARCLSLAGGWGHGCGEGQLQLRAAEGITLREREQKYYDMWSSLR